MRRISAFLTLGLAVPSAFAGFATVTVDGTVDAAYGAALAVQNANTSFGDATSGNLIGGGGSEMDALYVAHDNTNLYLCITGNLESNGNIHLVVIDNFDDNSGITGAFAGINGADGYFQTNGSGNGMGGSTFPSGMNVDYLGAFKCFNNPLEWRYQTSTDMATTTAFGNFATGATTNPAINSQNGYTFALNNANTAGVAGTGGGFPASGGPPGSVTTGLELAIPLTELGTVTLGTTQLGIFVAHTSGDANFFSNQCLPPAATPQDHFATDPNFTTLNTGFVTYNVVVPVELSVFQAN